MFDLVIKGGKVCDGTGSPWFYADVGVKGDRIACIGQIDPSDYAAGQAIDAAGKAVAPGFVDVHTHSDYSIVLYPRADSMVRQGVTTVINGNCGSSAGPVKSVSQHYSSEASELRKRPPGEAPQFDWIDLDGYFRHVEENGASVNMATFVGQSTVRFDVMGIENRPPTSEEMLEMQHLVREAIEQGAIGMSTGLVYVPSCYATTEELVELAGALKGLKGILHATHTRSLNEGLFEGNEEAVKVAEAAGIPLQISHMCPAPPLWDKSGEMLARLEAMRERGTQVTIDMFPYTYGGNSLFNQVPPWAREGGPAKLIERLKDKTIREKIKEDTLKYGSASGGSSKRVLIKEGRWDLIWISGARKNLEYNGMSMEEIAAARGQDPYEAMVDLTIEEGPNTAMMGGDRKEEDVAAVLAHPLTMVGSDGRIDAPYGDINLPVHPRAYGTFARVLARYVRERKVLTLEDAIAKMSSFPARTMGIYDRGLLRAGMFADIVVFDPETVSDRAGIRNPKEYATGVSHVIVNGRAVVSGGEHTGALPGKVLRRTC